LSIFLAVFVQITTFSYEVVCWCVCVRSSFRYSNNTTRGTLWGHWGWSVKQMSAKHFLHF